jgi:hypothetical protein
MDRDSARLPNLFQLLIKFSPRTRLNPASSRMLCPIFSRDLTPIGRSQRITLERKYRRLQPLWEEDFAQSYLATYSLPGTRCPLEDPSGNRLGYNPAILKRGELAEPIPGTERFAPGTPPQEKFLLHRQADTYSDNRKCRSIWG